MHAEIRGYLAYRKALGHSERTLVNCRQGLRYFSAFAKLPALRNVTSEMVRRYHDSLIERKLKSSSRLVMIAAIRRFLAWAHERGLILTDVAAQVEVPRQGVPLPPQPMTPDEVAEMIEMFGGRSAPQKRARAILELFYACGLRRSEVLNLNVGDVDFGEQTVFVRQGKGRKDRLLPIHEMALKAIAGYLETHGRVKKTEPLFTICGRDGKGRKRLDDTAIGNLFRWIDKRSGKHIHPHLFRHTFAVHLLQGGADVRYVQALLGHESLETTSRYLGLAKEDLKRTYDQAVESILGKPSVAG